MKLLSVEIHNIASVKHAVIDFTKEPLASESQFLITGQTGAGKTTILDSICLALYSTTPRMENNKDSEKFKDDRNKKEMSLKDSRSLMRNSEGEAWSIVTFEDKNGEMLVAKWYCARARKNVNGNIQDVELTLSRPDGTVITSKIRETQAEIVNRIGLSFEQFCRTSMLAQGEFTKFLRASESEKSDILEKLTGTKIYSELGVKIFNLYSEKNKELSLLKERTNGITILTEDEKAKIQEDIKALEEVIDEQSKAYKAFDDILKWMDDAEDLLVKEEKNKQDEIALEEKLNSEECVIAGKIVAQWDKSAEVRGVYERKEEELAKLATLKTMEVEAEEQFVTLTSELLSLEKECTIKEDDLKRVVAYLDANSLKTKIYDNLSLIKERMSVIDNRTAEQNKLAQEGKIILQEIASKDVELQEANEKLEKVNKSEKIKQSEINKKATEARGYNAEELVSRTAQITERKAELMSLKGSYESRIQKHTECETKQKQCDAQKRLITENETKCNESISETKMAEARLNVAELCYDKVKNANDDYMKMARAALAIDDECPLCGQKIKSIVNDEHIEAIIAPLRKDLEEAKAKCKEAQKHQSDSEVALRVSKETLQVLERELLSLKEDYETLEKALVEHRLWSEYATIDNPLEQMLQEMDRNDVEQKQINDTLVEYNKLQKEISILQGEVGVISKEKEALLAKISEAKEYIAKKKTEKESKEQGLEKAKSDVVNAENGITEIFGDNQWLQSWASDKETFVWALEKDASDYNQSKIKKVELEKELLVINQDLEDIAVNLKKVKDEYKNWNQSETMLQHSANLEDKWNEFYAQFNSMVTEINIHKSKLKEAEDKIKEYLAQEGSVTEDEIKQLLSMAAKIESMRALLEGLKAEKVRVATTKETLVKDRKKLEEMRVSIEENITKEMVIEKKKAAEEARDKALTEKGEYNNRIKQNEENQKQLKDIQEKIDEKDQEVRKWEQLNNIFGSSDGSKFRKIAQSYILNNMLSNANEYLRKFTTRYEMYSQVGSLLIEIRDKEDGDLVRPINNLSGGESFLVSLSLALGLSSLSNQAMAMDTIFIDEGFGTLDSEYLSTVIDTLDQLHHIDGKKVGIISHVESLKERIPAQIQVNRVGTSHSEVKVVSLI